MNYSLIQEPNVSLNTIQQVLLNRGIALEDQAGFLNAKDEAKEYNPYLLDHITTGIKYLLLTIKNNGNIHIQVDSDCDGYTSSALLINYLYSILPAWTQTHVTYALHKSKTHGIDMDQIPENTALVIAPDSSSNEINKHNQLADEGIHTIVLDHHHAESNGMDMAVIINNQMCDYPNKDFSGVGIVYKFCEVLDERLQINKAKDFKDLVALGNIGDMMDIRSLETKKLIEEGLEDIHNPFFSYMCQKNAFQLGDNIDAHGVAWFIVPYINAVTRIGTDQEKELVFKSMLTMEASKEVPSTKRGHAAGETEILVEQAVRVCANIKRHQDEEKKQALTTLMQSIEEERLADAPMIIAINKQPINDDSLQGITGLLANSIMSEYGKPTILLNRINTNNGVLYKGSGRGFAVEGIKDWRAFVEQNGAQLAQGHAMAFGVEFTEAQLQEFKDYLNFCFQSKPFEKIYYVDYILPYYNKNIPVIIQDIARYNIWGQGVSEPYIAVTNIPINENNMVLYQKGVLKISPNDDYNCIKFNSDIDEYNSLLNSKKIDIIGTCTINTFNGKTIAQLKIVDWKKAENTWEYDF